MDCTGEHNRLLADVLWGLKPATGRLNVSVTDLSYHNSDRLPADSSFKACSDRDPSLGFLEPTGKARYAPLQTIVAIRKAGIRLGNFAMGVECCSAARRCLAVPLYLFKVPAGFRSMGDNFCGLTTLNLVLDQVFGASGTHDSRAEVLSFVAFLQSLAPSLKRLELSQNTSEETSWEVIDESEMMNDVFWELSKSLTLLVLEYIKLDSIDSEYRPLVEFLTRHAKTLQSYDLSDLIVTDLRLEMSESECQERLERDLFRAGFPLGQGRLKRTWRTEWDPSYPSTPSFSDFM